jgi:uncharacterized protein YhfF/cyclopropane fatty-acyl-phospholipid synthase-like methyltransferase
MFIDHPACDAFYREYLATLPSDHPHHHAKPDRYGFGGEPTLAEELAELTVAGRKRATTSLPIEYTSLGEPLPRVGDLSIIVRGSGRPAALIECTELEIVPFGSVDAAFAAVEGEGDGSLAYWRRAHIEYFTGVCQRLGGSFDDSTEVICHVFRVISRANVQAMPQRPSARYSRIAHGLLPVCAPLDQKDVHEVLGLLPLSAQSRVLDVGCGRAATLIDLVHARGVRGTGVDFDAEALRIARASAEARGCAAQLTLIESRALDVAFDEPFDLTLCVGSSHALGGRTKALEHLARWTRPGAYALLGEGFWKRDPDPAYLAAIGSSKHDLSTHYENAAAAHAHGWSVVWSVVTSDASFDRYEALYRLSMARYLAEHPDDPDAAAFRERSERWYDSYLRWGRETMGFALYLLERRA